MIYFLCIELINSFFFKIFDPPSVRQNTIAWEEIEIKLIIFEKFLRRQEIKTYPANNKKYLRNIHRDINIKLRFHEMFEKVVR